MKKVLVGCKITKNLHLLKNNFIFVALNVLKISHYI